MGREIDLTFSFKPTDRFTDWITQTEFFSQVTILTFSSGFSMPCMMSLRRTSYQSHLFRKEFGWHDLSRHGAVGEGENENPLERKTNFSLDIKWLNYIQLLSPYYIEWILSLVNIDMCLRKRPFQIEKSRLMPQHSPME